jgi:hypothetical protein
MTQGVVKTQGTRLFFASPDAASSSDPDGVVIYKLACPTGINGLGGARGQIDTTCLDSIEMEKQGGMLDPTELSAPFNFIPGSFSHQALLDLRESGTLISWMIVFSDQTGSPSAVDSDSRLVSPGATTAEFLGYVADVTFDIATNEIVRGTLTIQRSGPAVWTLPAATQD